MSRITARKVDLDVREELILDAALVVFAEKSFHGASLPEIAREAGVAVGTIYLHFKSKETLANALYRRCQNDYLQVVYGDLPDQATVEEVVFTSCRRVAEYIQRNPLVLRFLELHDHSSYLDGKSRQLQRRHVERIARGEVGRMPRQVVVALIWGTIAGIVRLEKAGHMDLGRENVDALAGALLAALQSSEG